MIEFRVDGSPITQGSLKSFLGKNGKVCTFHDNPLLKDWRNQIKRAVWRQNTITPNWKNITESNIGLKVVFYLDNPLTGGDLDKLIRAVGDALTGVCYVDDRQITRIYAEKRNTDQNNPAGVVITLKTLE